LSAWIDIESKTIVRVSALGVRSRRDSLRSAGLCRNPTLLIMIFAVFLLQISVLYVQPLQIFFSTTPLSFWEFAFAISIGLVVLAAIEWSKKIGSVQM